MKCYDELKDKVVLITGGTQGIGEAVTNCFTEQQSQVVINGRKLDEKVQKVIDRTGAYPAMGDLSNKDRATEIVRETIDKFGKIDILVANGAAMSMNPFLEQNEDEWWQQINVNLTGHIASIKAALPNMISNGGGTIIIISSFFGTLGWKNATGYGSSKSGLLTLGQYLSREYKKYNINVGIIIPGVIRTPQLNVDANDLGISYDEVCDMYASEIAMARLGDPEEIASLVAFMSTKVGGRGLSGRHVQVSGGEYRTTPYYV
ncbi:MAG: SDR family oxidoreductase [Peptostreptococcaceae bacterium]|nr:SDR family oxidoreductase [Peptostreptococcaceae bacterium]